MKFGAWFQPTGRRTWRMESCWSQLSGTIIHIIVSIIQLITVVWPELWLLQECPMHCRYAGDDSGCHFRLRKHHSSCIWCRKGWISAVHWLLFLIMTLLLHLLLKLVALFQTNRCDSAWHFLKKRSRRHPPSHRISVHSKQKHNGLNPKAWTCHAPMAGRLQERRSPGRPDGCRKASQRSWQGETDRQRFWQLLPFCPATRDLQ